MAIDDGKAWDLIHQERARTADLLASLTAEQWAQPSACAGWSVGDVAGHLVAGAEQTTGHFLGGMVKHAFRFNRMMDRDARSLGALPRAELVARLRARTTTTNKPPAPVLTMLGEVVVHAEDIRQPLGITSDVGAEALTTCLTMYTASGFPIGSKKRIAGRRLVATDVDWSFGEGRELRGPGAALLLAMTGRPGVTELVGVAL